MTLIQQPNAWTCGPCALAMAIGVPLDDVIAAAGHDGVIDGMTVGFNEADLTLAALRLGFATVRLPMLPTLIPRWPAPAELLGEIAGPMVLIVAREPGKLHSVAIEECRPGAEYLDPWLPEPQPIERIPPVKYVEFFLRLPRPWAV